MKSLIYLLFIVIFNNNSDILTENRNFIPQYNIITEGIPDSYGRDNEPPPATCDDLECDPETEQCCEGSENRSAQCAGLTATCCPGGGSCSAGTSCCGSGCCADHLECCEGTRISKCVPEGGQCCPSGWTCKAGQTCCGDGCINTATHGCCNNQPCQRPPNSCLLNKCRVSKVCGVGCKNYTGSGMPCCNYGFDGGVSCKNSMAGLKCDSFIVTGDGHIQ